MVLQFRDVEVIELQFVAGDNYPFNRFLKGKAKSRCKHDRQKQHGLEDSSSIALGWIAQTRTIVDFETYEEHRQERKLMALGKDNPDGRSQTRVRRLTRAVRKRL
jgi:hypothetical protein